MEQQEEQRQESRNLIVRAFALIGWFLLFFIVTNLLVGGIVGAIAGAKTTTTAAGYAAGQQAAKAFWPKFGGVVLAAQVITFAVLAYLGQFPGTRKYKKAA